MNLSWCHGLSRSVGPHRENTFYSTVGNTMTDHVMVRQRVDESYYPGTLAKTCELPLIGIKGALSFNEFRIRTVKYGVDCLRVVNNAGYEFMMSDPVSVSIVLSDMVICERGTNKNTLIGCFHTLNAPGFPFPTPPFYITVVLTNLASTTKEFNVVVRIEDPASGYSLVSVGGNMKFAPEFNVTKEMAFELPFVVPPFIIQKPGNYEVKILVNNSDAGKRLLTVNPITAGSQPQQKL